MPRTTERFDVSSYLEARKSSPDLLVVEYGHRAAPVAFAPEANFTNRRAYIGVEANMRESSFAHKQQLQDKICSREAIDENVFFIEHDLGGSLVLEDPEVGLRYVGGYNAQTVLPDGLADEVFAGNVLGDPLVAGNSEYVRNFVAEIARVSNDAGRIVLRETITPEYAQSAGEMMSNSGLSVMAVVGIGSPEWDALERTYNADYGNVPNSLLATGSFYMFLQKQAR